jgi:hypothetical protein
VGSSRRRFLKVAGLAAGGAALGMTGWSCADPDENEAARKPDDKNSLSAAELDQVVLISAVLFEPEDETERRDLETTMRWWANGRTTRGPHLAKYRAGIAALGSGKTFANMSPAKRTALITPLMKADKEAPFKALANDLLEGIYSSAPGWKSLGYTTWPGVPSAPLEYTTKPHGPARVISGAQS